MGVSIGSRIPAARGQIMAGAGVSRIGADQIFSSKTVVIIAVRGPCAHRMLTLFSTWNAAA